MRKGELYSVAILIIGVCAAIAGTWLIWDLMNTVKAAIPLEHFCEHFRFYLPFFVEEVRCDRWTMPFDIGLTLIGIGLITAIIGSWLTCYYK